MAFALCTAKLLLGPLPLALPPRREPTLEADPILLRRRLPAWWPPPPPPLPPVPGRFERIDVACADPILPSDAPGSRPPHFAAQFSAETEHV